jgi:hypothetical protein
MAAIASTIAAPIEFQTFVVDGLLIIWLDPSGEMLRNKTAQQG